MAWVRFQQVSEPLAPSTAQTAPVAEPSAVELTVDRQGEVLIVQWNPAAAVVSKATHGVLTITDGEFERRIGLNSRELQLGSTKYAPLYHNVSFQLTLYNSPASGKGSVLFLARGGENEDRVAPPSIGSEQELAVSRTISDKPATAERFKDTRAKRHPEENEPARPPAVASRPVETATVTPPPAPEPLPPAAIASPIPEVLPQPVGKPVAAPPPVPSYRVTVTEEPSHGNRVEQVLSKVPFVRRITKVASPSELVKPVRRVEPVLAGTPLTEATQASVEVQVDHTGAVKSAKLVDLGREPGNIDWAVLRAAKSWKFESPQEGQSSWLVLTFRFEPTRSARAE